MAKEKEIVGAVKRHITIGGKEYKAHYTPISDKTTALKRVRQLKRMGRSACIVRIFNTAGESQGWKVYERHSLPRLRR